MSDEKKDWEQRFNHKWRQGVRDPHGDTYYPTDEHEAPRLEDCTAGVKTFIRDELARVRAEEAAKHKKVVEAKIAETSDVYAGHSCVREALDYFKATLNNALAGAGREE